MVNECKQCKLTIGFAVHSNPRKLNLQCMIIPSCAIGIKRGLSDEGMFSPSTVTEQACIVFSIVCSVLK